MKNIVPFLPSAELFLIGSNGIFLFPDFGICATLLPTKALFEEIFHTTKPQDRDLRFCVVRRGILAQITTAHSFCLPRERSFMNDDNFIMLPTVDFCFKELMQNAKVRQGFIAALLEVPPEEVADTQLLPTILRQNSSDDKLSILDVRVRLQDGTQIDMEMQVAYLTYWTRRAIFYLSKMFIDPLQKGDSYKKLQKCIHVSILNFNQFKDDERCYRTVNFRDAETNELYSDLLEIKVLELNKLPRELPCSNSVYDWIAFFRGQTREDFADMSKTNEYMDEAYQTLLGLSADEIKRIEYEARNKALSDHNSYIEDYYERGMQAGTEKGIAIGEERGKAEGEARGIAIGEARGEARGIAIGEARGKAEGEARGIELTKQIFKLCREGKTNEEIAQLCQVEVARVEEILD